MASAPLTDQSVDQLVAAGEQSRCREKTTLVVGWDRDESVTCTLESLETILGPPWQGR